MGIWLLLSCNINQSLRKLNKPCTGQFAPYKYFKKMNKTYKILSLLILINSFTFSQNCGEVDYTFTFVVDASYTNTEHYKLTFNNNESLCIENKINKKNNSIKKTNTDEGSITNHYAERKMLIKKFFYNNKKNLFFKDIFQSTTLLVKENDLIWNWKLNNETKKIGLFNCNKANITFRGRNYTAWYTTEIPVSFGPWKFNGLPGLILEIYDTRKEFHIYPNKIKINKNDCKLEFEKKQLNLAMNLVTYLKKKDSLIDKLFARMSAKRSKGSKPFKRDKNCTDCSKGIENFYEKN